MTLIFCLCSLNAWAAVDLRNGLVGWWKFDESSGTLALDSSEQGNNGSLLNSPQRVIGKRGQGLNFFPNGADTDAWVRVLDPASGVLDFAGDFTVCAWVRARVFVNQGSSANVVVSKKNVDVGITTAGYTLAFASSNSMRLTIGDGTDGVTISDPSTMNDGLWHFWAFSRSGITVTLYRDAVSVATDNTVTGSLANNLALGIGSEPGIPAFRSINGDIDEVRMYNRALTIDEIRALMLTPVKVRNAKIGQARISN